MHVLWVDDEPRVLGEWHRFVQEAGHVILDCIGPDEALDMLEEKKNLIDRVIIDIMLHTGMAYKDVDTGLGMKTGLFLAAEIRHQLPEVPILLLTNKRVEQVRSEVDEEFPSVSSASLMDKPHHNPHDVLEWLLKPAAAEEIRP